ncbi:prepilin-type N-terminal cleavage/methylation domain-containing protein [Actinoplanes sp. NPDC051411]|uniref:type II secretion system protein n=1 Tax=Actinoplanes sp. NPDC051411 TaxID=3155522 RepID=UPI00343C6CAA
MHDIISRLRAKKGDEGFTLIELLVVVVIIGVLVAIAVPVYLNYRKGAADKSAQSDVRGAVSTIEQFYTDNGNTYPNGTSCTKVAVSFQLTAAATGCSLTQPAAGNAAPAGWVVVSDKTTMSYVPTPPTPATAPITSYKVCATNGGGSGKIYVYDSSKGGSVTAATTAVDIATCA